MIKTLQPLIDLISTHRRTALLDGVIGLAQYMGSAVEPEKKLEHICAAVQSLLRCDRSSLFVLDGNQFRGFFNVGNPPDVAEMFPHHRVPLNDPLVGEAFARKTFVLSNNAGEDPRMRRGVAQRARIRSIVIAPLFDQNDAPLAFITAEFNESVGHFSELESRVLMGIARLSEVVFQSMHLRQTEVELAHQLAQAARLDSIGRLSAGVAHDLNNRLTVIMGGLELLQDQIPERTLSMVMEASEAAARMSRQLLQFGQADHFEDTRACKPTEILEKILHELKVLVSERCDLEIETTAQCTVLASVTQVEQIISNLVINAFDASPNGGMIRVQSFDENGSWVLRVEDHGTGIPADLQDKIYEPFVTTKKTGTGLGLSSVYGIVQTLQGTINFQTEDERGTTFEVRLPVSNGASTATRQPTSASQTQSRMLSIALVEDDEGVRRYMEQTLRTHGHEVRVYASSREAVASIEGDVALLISDVIMPDLDGIEMCVQLRTRYPTLPILLISGYFPNLDLGRVPGTGPIEFLSKPFSTQQLHAKIAAIGGAIEAAG